MRNAILFALIGLGGLVTAQQQNDQLKKQLENNRIEKKIQLDFYLSKTFSNDNLSKNSNEIINNDDFKKYVIDNQSKISFFFEGDPYFLKPLDTDQIKNNNVDALQEGNINGLNGSFNGEGINISVFDGGRVYDAHIDLQNPTNTGSRVTNKETDAVPYDSHATGVTDMIGGTGRELFTRDANGTRIPVGNSKGMAPLATFDSYSFDDTVLLGENTQRSVTEKLLLSLANISNHSYGGSAGWNLNETSTGIRYWRWIGFYDPTSQTSYDLNGAYFINDRNYDDIVYNNPSMIVVKSAGNSFGDGPIGSSIDLAAYSNNGRLAVFNSATDIIPENNCSSGYDCIPTGSVAKNIILVGSTEKITTNNKRYTNSTDVVKSDFSSAGPRDDGAIKPDIAGVGSDILHASTNETGSNSWNIGSGTSYSAPQVTGIIALWTEVNKALFNSLLNASSAKTLLIHSAQEAGTTDGPDLWFGWGFADAKKGAELLVAKSNNKIIFEDKTLQNNAVDELLLESNGSEPLKVTISWVDPSFKNYPNTYNQIHNNRTSVLINDLDLKITNVKTKEVFYPWKLDLNNLNAGAITGDNTVDNVEQVLIKTPVAGIYKVEVSHKGNLVNNDNAPTIAPQTYSIIATGYNKIKNAYSTDGIDTNVYPTLLTNNDKFVYIDAPKQINNVSIYNMDGRLLKSETISRDTHKLDFSSLPQGVYIINIELSSSKEPLVRKVLKR